MKDPTQQPTTAEILQQCRTNVEALHYIVHLMRYHITEPEALEHHIHLMETHLAR
jgi:hypothetical protein